MMNEAQAKELIETTIKDNDVVLFMKGTADFPMCGFSGKVTQILRYYQVNFKDINILDDETLRSTIKSFSNWPTIPQLYVKGEFVGGCDIVSEMAQEGELVEMFKSKGISVSDKS